MDKLIYELEEMSQALIPRLDRVSFEELSGFADQRQHLIDSIAKGLKEQALNVEQKERLKNVMQSDAIIRGRMEALRDEASDWLLQRGQAKVQRNAYESVYSADSILMDRKK
ncbi:hypothetical protein PMSD_08995 [Paenibacillus macquariensis subsp. defensor]|nr:hypothetical protein PMSD_08995 [Paenibacillus macquariensis subsp. defensor]